MMTSSGIQEVEEETILLQNSEVATTCSNSSNTSTILFSDMTQPTIPISIELTLTKEEQDLFDLLIQTGVAYELGHIELPDHFLVPCNGGGSRSNNTNKKKMNQKLEIRIAGGWVRDKILNKQSHDIDVTLNCMSGYAFATLVQLYLQGRTHDPHATTTTASTTLPKIAVIQANPAQSKHLETATMKLCNMDIDFTNLRAEELYHDHSRIPTNIQVGTPKEDAYRRDFTINSLFYNIHTRQIEDFTTRGIHDLLVEKQLVTPLNAHVTFLDDPLRVLRAIRFSVRYNLDLHPDIWDAATSIQVHQALHLKVSRERVGTELDGMLIGKAAQPGRALHLLTQLKLAGSVFCFPSLISTTSLSLEKQNTTVAVKNNAANMQQKDMIARNIEEEIILEGNLMGYNYSTLTNVEEKCHVRELAWLESTHLIHIVPFVLEEFQSYNKTHLYNIDGITTGDQVQASRVDIRLFYLSTFLIPLRYLTYLDKKKKQASLVSYIVRESIKFKNKDVVEITMILDHIPEMLSLLDIFRNNDWNHPSRLELGLFLRKVKDLWVTLLLVCTVWLIRQADEQLQDSKDHQSKFVDLCFKLYKIIVELDLDRCWTIRPLIDGRELITLLGITAGPQVAMYLDEQTKWMLVHPQGLRDDCEAFLKHKQKEESMDGDYVK